MKKAATVLGEKEKGRRNERCIVIRVNKMVKRRWEMVADGSIKTEVWVSTGCH